MLWLMSKTFGISQLKVIWEDITFKNIATSQGDDYTTGCLLDYLYFKVHYRLTAIDLSKQEALAADSKAIKQINFTGNLVLNVGATMFFIIEETKETVLDFSQGTVKVFSNFIFSFNIK